METNTKLIPRMLSQFVIVVLLFTVALFVPAATVEWPAGWIYLALFFSFFAAVNLWLLRHNPGLLEERLRMSSPDQKGWDRILFTILLIIPFAWMSIMALDAKRFHWSSLPLWFQAVGIAILLGSFYLLFLTFRENSYLSTVVRIQDDRGHSVVSTGPYHIVRHPMYLAMLLFAIGTPLLLGSGIGVLLGLMFIVVLARRAVLEELTLRDELPGYADYMTQVKYRIIPYIW
jgi:protein-S-isoprenylcysteine O-methyltransferase Ste14